MFPNLLRSTERYILPLGTITFAIPFVALLFYAVPATDDFCKATFAFVDGAPQSGVLPVTWLYFTRWSSRWVTILVQSFVMSRVNLVVAYGWLLLGLLIVSLASLWYFFRTCLSVSSSTALMMAGVFFAAWVASVPSPAEQLYWLTGYTEYYLSISTLLFLVSLLCQPRRRAWYATLIVVLSVAIPAQHEIAGAFLCALLVTACVILRLGHQPAWQWKLSLAAAVLSQAIVLLAPGNRMRATQEHRKVWDVAHLPYWMAHGFYHGLQWLAYPAFLLAVACIVLLCQTGDLRIFSPVPLKWLGMAGALGTLVILCEFGLVEMASGNWSPDRVVGWYLFVFWLLFVFAAVAGSPDVLKLRVSATMRTCMFALFIVALLSSANFRSAVSDLKGSARQLWKTESAQLGKRGARVLLEVPDEYPKLAMHQELQVDSGCWVNRCVANYLHAKVVIANQSDGECPGFFTGGVQAR